MIVDTHIHLWEFSRDERRRMCRDDALVMLAVSDDLSSSRKTLELRGACSNTYLAVGIHPWEVGNASDEELEEVVKLVPQADALGEVGLDRKFVPKTYERQLRFFNTLIEVAVKHGKPVSVHAAGAWNDVIEALESAGVKHAIIHWFTGPRNLIRRIEELGYLIGVNPAVKIQKKAREVIKVASLETLVTESDGPYKYRGMMLAPALIPEVLKVIAEVKGLSTQEVRKVIADNFRRFVRSSGLPELPHLGSDE